MCNLNRIGPKCGSKKQIHRSQDYFQKISRKNDLIRATIIIRKCNILWVPNCYASNRCNHKFWVPLKTFDGQNESSNKRINGIDELLAIRLKGSNHRCCAKKKLILTTKPPLVTPIIVVCANGCFNMLGCSRSRHPIHHF